MQNKGLLLTSLNLKISVILLSELWELVLLDSWTWSGNLWISWACRRKSGDMPRKPVLFSICDCRCFWPLIQDSLWVTLLSEQSCVGEHLNNCLGVYNRRVFWEGHVTPGAYWVTARNLGFGDLVASGAVTDGAENNGATWIWILPEAWI